MKVMFAVADANGDGTLSFEEVTVIHKRIFDRVDADKDGTVTLEELHARIAVRAQCLTRRRLRPPPLLRRRDTATTRTFMCRQYSPGMFDMDSDLGSRCLCELHVMRNKARPSVGMNRCRYIVRPAFAGL
jgi:hypothetical protein